MTEFRADSYEDARPGDRRVTSRSNPPVEKDRDSPFADVALHDSQAVVETTRSLLHHYPLGAEQVIDVVEWAWSAIFDSQIGPAQIGHDLFPTPQVLSMFLHELVPLQLRTSVSKDWRSDRSADEKDVVYEPNREYDTEIKASSSDRQIFGNRSFGQPGSEDEKKKKSGYYIAINFEKWQTDSDGAPLRPQRPDIKLVRIGWLDHTDWYAQAAGTGQAASLAPMTENTQLLTLYAKR